MTTLAGGSEAGTADGAGAAAHFKHPCRLRLNERGCLFVTEYDSEDTLRVVEASAPAWMGPVAALQAETRKDLAFEKLLDLAFEKLREREREREVSLFG